MIRRVMNVLAVVVVGLCSCTTTPPPREVYVADEEVPAAPVKRERIKNRPASELPRVVIMVDEQSLGTIPTAEVEAIGVEQLRFEGVPVVDQDMARANLAKGKQLFKSTGDNRAAASLGAQFGADVVIIGEAVAKPSARRIAGSNLRTYQAVVTLRAIRTDNAATLCAASKDGSIVGLDDVSGSAKALRDAGEKAMGALIPRMLNTWEPGSGRPAQTQTIELSVGGVDALWKLKAIREGLRGMKDSIQNVTQRSYTAGLANFSLESTLPAEELVEEIVLNPPQDIRFQALEVLPNQLQIQVVSE